MGVWNEADGPWVGVYSQVSCNSTQLRIDITSWLALNNAVIAGGDSPCGSTTYCNSVLLVGPYPPSGTYGGSNYATAQHDQTSGFSQSMTADAGSMYYG